jgi:hypothetical protein
MSTPAGFSTPAVDTQVSANVAAPSVQVTTAVTIGNNLQVQGTVTLSQPAPSGGLLVTLSTLSSSLKLSSNPASAGLSSTQITVPEGETSGVYYIQGFANSGTATYTGSAPGFTARSGTVTFAPSGVTITGPSGLGIPFFSTTLGNNVALQVATAVLDPTNLNKVAGQEQLAGGLSVNVTINNSSSSVGTLDASVTIVGGSDYPNATFVPVGTGTTFISVNAPAGFTASGNNVALQGIVQ